MAKTPRKNAQPDPAEDAPALSLDALSEAFAAAMGQAEPPSPARHEQHVSSGEPPSLHDRFSDPIIEADALASAPGDEQCEIGPLTILEALLFVGDPSGGAIPSERLAGVMRGVETAEIHGLVEELNRRYAEQGRPYRIVGEGPGYRLALRHEYHGVREKFFGRVKQARLSQAAVDVLALVAYNQPLAADEIQKLRGTPSGAVLSQLVRRQLLAVERPDGSSRVFHYRTTQRFLEIFGLQSLDDLPTSRDLDEK